MADPSVVINLAAEYTGNKAFKQADNATAKLTKNVKNLAKTFGVAFGTAAVLKYAKASVMAAAADKKAQTQLALALKNVGLERDAASAESYIQKLQSEFGIVDDLLRPAYQKLAVATRDTAETQRLLGIALDVSASTGKDLDSVTSALSKAYLGNNTALGKLGVGISKADLKTKSFKDITDQLAITFKGAATAAADTFAGSMARLAVASNNAKEIIGTGIIDALTSLGDNKSVSNLATQMESVATFTADAIRGIGLLIAELQKIPGAGVIGDIIGFANKTSLIGQLASLGKDSRTKPKPFNTPMSISSQTQLKTQTKVTALTKTQAAAALAVTKAKKDQLALDKASLALAKGQDIFNMDAIELNAAMVSSAQALGNATNKAQVLAITNDLARLVIKQDMLTLEDAIAAKDVNAATAAAKKLNADIAILGALNNQALKLVDIKNIVDQIVPKKLIDLDNIDAAILKIIELNRLQGLKVSTTGTITALPVTPVTPVTPTAKGNTDYVAPVDSATAALASVTSILEYADAATARANAMADLLDAQTAAANAAFMSGSLGTIQGVGGTTTLNFNAPIYTVSDAEFAANVQKAIQNNNRFGNTLTYAGAI